MAHDGMVTPVIVTIPVKVPEVLKVRTVNYKVITVKDLHRVPSNTGTVTGDIKNNLIFRMDVEEAALIVDPLGPEAGAIIMPDADYFRNHIRKCLWSG
jgi:hypothetical protein